MGLGSARIGRYPTQDSNLHPTGFEPEASTNCASGASEALISEVSSDSGLPASSTRDGIGGGASNGTRTRVSDLASPRSSAELWTRKTRVSVPRQHDTDFYFPRRSGVRAPSWNRTSDLILTKNALFLTEL